MSVFSHKKGTRRAAVETASAARDGGQGRRPIVARPKGRVPGAVRTQPPRPRPVVEPIQAEALQEPRVPWHERVWGKKDWTPFRIHMVFALFLIFFIALWGRAGYLQLVRGPKLAAMAQSQYASQEMVSGRRGMISDRNGQVLARSVETFSVSANPRAIKDLPTTANTLGAILGIPPQTLFDDLAKSRKSYVRLSRRIDDAAADAIRRAKLPGISLNKEYERVYPFRHLAGQLLGFVGLEDKGLEGLERRLDSRLSCATRKQIVQRAPGGKVFYLHEEGEEDPHGEDVTLTIDVQMQYFAEEALAHAVREAAAKWGGALVVHVPTGDILAWAQYPFFNPNAYSQAKPEVYRNRLAQDALEPGSTFKPFVMAAALQEHKVTKNTPINCEMGRWQTKYVTIRDTSRHGEIPASKVIRYSSNIGMAKIGLMLGSRHMYSYLHALGFGQKTGLNVSDREGILRKPRQWSEVDTMSTSFGQAVSVTGLQMVQAYLAILNDGVSRPLRLVVGDTYVDQPRERIFSEQVCREIRQMMRDVVEEKDGTGTRARIEGIPVAGKTGTAQKADRRAGVYGAKRLASFIGFLPADDPVYLILVMIDEPQNGKYGGIISAPVFKEIAQRCIAYSGAVHREGEPAAPKKKTEAAPHVRGFKVSGPDHPFVQPNGPRRPKSPRPLMLKVDLPDPAEQLVTGRAAKPPATVPDVTGRTLRAAVELFARAGVIPLVKGTGSRIVRQTPAPGTAWPSAQTGQTPQTPDADASAQKTPAKDAQAQKAPASAGRKEQLKTAGMKDQGAPPEFILWLSDK